MNNLDAAVSEWGQFIEGRGQLWIEVVVTRHTSGGRFTGSSTGAVFVEQSGIFHIFEFSGSHKLRTGRSVDPGIPDVRIEVQPDYMREHYWIDPSPRTRDDPVPLGKMDLITVLVHELGHGLGFNGWLDRRTGAAPSDNGISVYDKHIIQRGNLPYFVGPIARRAYRKIVPLTFFSKSDQITIQHGGEQYFVARGVSQNIYHLGRFDQKKNESALSFHAVMAGAWPSRVEATAGDRIRLNRLDVSVLLDLGLPPTAAARAEAGAGPSESLPFTADYSRRKLPRPLE